MFGGAEVEAVEEEGEAVEGADDEAAIVSAFAGAASEVVAGLMAALVSPSKSKSFSASIWGHEK